MFMTPMLAPMVAMAAISFILMFGMVIARRRAVMDKKTNPKDLLVRGGKNPWPPQAAQFSDAYQNSLELPILFYVVMLLAVIAGSIDNIFLGLAWLFAACRAAQAFVHVTSNTRKYRSYAFRAGALALLAMWVLFTVRLVSEG
jgi:hypothetical protein